MVVGLLFSFWCLILFVLFLLASPRRVTVCLWLFEWVFLIFFGSTWVVGVGFFYVRL